MLGIPVCDLMLDGAVRDVVTMVPFFPAIPGGRGRADGHLLRFLAILLFFRIIALYSGYVYKSVFYRYF